MSHAIGNSRKSVIEIPLAIAKKSMALDTERTEGLRRASDCACAIR